MRFGATLKNSNGSVIQPTPTRQCDYTGSNHVDPCPLVSVKEGWCIAVKASDFHTVSCTFGSPAQLEFQPPLTVGGAYQTADDTNGCKLLVELQYQ